MNLVEKVMLAGQPLNADQLRVLLAGCDVFVTPSEAQWLYSRYAHLKVQHKIDRALSRS
ncbi:hypothetical protein [Sulfobacillus thermosulfidooxidans]|uniref:hypothetical protein n=1 Tax=Sulfobacillus thermosulfidooxidans TaxID=28034 RepID=UPI001300D3D7|nr:hypothetical protein [Sulfobacillus thermosulfidooxidans]